jgi:TonB family protein
MKPIVYLLALLMAAGSASLPVLAQGELGVPPYPNATPMPEVVTRLTEGKGSTWLGVGAYRTDNSIKDVVKYFRDQAGKAKKPSIENEHVRRLLLDNWKIMDGTVSNANEVFGVNKALRGVAKERTRVSFGAILLDESFVRVHIMAPYPVPPDGMTVAEGTMIVMIRERMTDLTDTPADPMGQEPVYTGREVTRKIRLRSKPEPPGVQGLHGTVVLKAIFGANGKVYNIVVVQSVPGLTEEAIRAARKITFDPAIKDGRYVSMWLQLEYNFN